MNIAVLGTGMVGRALAGKLATLGHQVTMGTRDVEQTLARVEPDSMGNVPVSVWLAEHPEVSLAPFAVVATSSDLVVNATNGQNALLALDLVGATQLAGKVLLDVALPLDLSQGMPPTLTISSTSSLAEQIQAAYPQTRVVKSLNTVFAPVMVDPARVPGRHNIFVAGDDAAAKGLVIGVLGEFGWPAEAVIDLGGIEGARGAEMYARLYFELVAALGTFELNIAVLKGTR